MTNETLRLALDALETDLIGNTNPQHVERAAGLIRSAIAAEQAKGREAVTDWSVEQLKLLHFLDGAGDFDGVWFGEKHPTEHGVFWWRKHLRLLLSTPPAQPAREWVGLVDVMNTGKQSLQLVFESRTSADAAKVALELKLREKNAGQPVVKEN